MRLHTIVLLFVAAPNAALAQTTTPVSLGDAAAIATALGVDARQMHGLVTVQIQDGGSGGRIGFPPVPVDEVLCKVDTLYFEGDATTGYKKSGEPYPSYWLRPVGAGCEARTVDDIPAERTGARASIPTSDVRAILEQSREFIDTVRDFPYCEGTPRFWATFVPRYITGIEPRGDFQRYTAAIAEDLDRRQPYAHVDFALAGGKVVPHRMCGPVFSDPVGYEDRVSEFVFP